MSWFIFIKIDIANILKNRYEKVIAIISVKPGEISMYSKSTINFY
jgi:hypothetical protein